MEQSQHEQIHRRGGGRDEGSEAHGVITAPHPDSRYRCGFLATYMRTAQK